MSDRPEIKIGQLWRRKRDEKVVWVSALRRYGTQLDVEWRAVEGKGKGQIYEFNLRKNYDLIEEAEG